MPSPVEDFSMHRRFPEFLLRFRKICELRGLTIKNLVQATNLARPTLTRLLNRGKNFRMDTIANLARGLAVPIFELLGPESRDGLAPTNGGFTTPLLAPPPRGDADSLVVYRACVRPGVTMAEVRGVMDKLSYLRSGEKTREAISRAVLDVFSHRLAWIDHGQLPRDTALEREIQETWNLLPCDGLEDSVPVRVLDLDPNLFHLITIHALGVVTASIVKELLADEYSVIGFSDGFMARCAQGFLLRGDLSDVTLVPLVFNPGMAATELSGTTLLGSLALTHHGYGVRSTVALKELQTRLQNVEVAVTSCGPASEDENGRIGLLIRELLPPGQYVEFLEDVRKKEVVGDLMYHFLRGDGRRVTVKWSAGDLERISSDEVPREPSSQGPVVYSPSLDYMSRIANRGVSLLIVHSPDRARLVRAALKRKKRPINFIVTTKAAALEILKR